MASNNSQSPDGPNFEATIEDILKLIATDLTIEGLLKLIAQAVRYAYRFYGHHPNPQDVEDLTQVIAILLIRDNCRVLRSFEQRSSLETWLKPIARHCVLRFFQGQKSLESLENLSPDDFVSQPEMEGEVFIEEIKGLLTLHDQELLELRLQGLTREEIAGRLNIELDSVDKAVRRLRGRVSKYLESK